MTTVKDEQIHVFGVGDRHDYRLVGDSDGGLRGILIEPEGEVGTYTLQFNSLRGLPMEKEFEAVTDFFTAATLAVTYLQGLARGSEL